MTAILLERDLKILDSGTTGWWVASPIILSENCFQPTILYHAKLSLKCEARKDRFQINLDYISWESKKDKSTIENKA